MSLLAFVQSQLQVNTKGRSNLLPQLINNVYTQVAYTPCAGFGYRVQASCVCTSVHEVSLSYAVIDVEGFPVLTTYPLRLADLKPHISVGSDPSP